MSQELISDEAFNNFLCTEVASVLQAANGAQQESYLPLLVILEYAEDEAFPVKVVALTFENFNDTEIRHQAIFELGRWAYEQEMQPVAAFLSSEAWIRLCRPEEYDPNRRVADYDDKQEVLIVVGLTLDGRSNAAHFMIDRDSENCIQLGTPTFLPYREDGETTMQPNLLANFFAGYLDELRQQQN